MAEDLSEDFEQVGDADDDEVEESGSKGGSKKKILLIVLPVLLIIGAALGAYFTGVVDSVLAMVSGGSEEVEVVEAEPESHGGDEPVPGQAVFYDLPEMLVNLNSPGRKQSFLKIRVSLELSKPDDVQTVETVMPRVVDSFQTYLRELRVEELQGASGTYRLREELLTRVNQAVRPAKVSAVWFRDMLVQ